MKVRAPVSPRPQSSSLIHDTDSLDIVAVSDADTRGTYVFEVNHLTRTALRNAVTFSRQQLIHQVAKKGFNVLVLERWVCVSCYYAASNPLSAGG